jgi:hypothetical protein
LHADSHPANPARFKQALAQCLGRTHFGLTIKRSPMNPQKLLEQFWVQTPSPTWALNSNLPTFPRAAVKEDRKARAGAVSAS